MKDVAKLSMQTCKRRLTAVWIGGTLVLFAVILAKSTTGKYADASPVWDWLFTYAGQPLLLMLGTVAADFNGKTSTQRNVDPYFYRLALGASVLILTAMLFVLVAVEYKAGSNVQHIGDSETWLRAVQAAVAILLGMFFIREPASGGK